MRFFVAGIALLLTAVASTSGLAATPASPPPDLPPSLAAATLALPRVSGFRVTSFAARFEQVPLARLQRRLGSGEIQHRGDAGDALYWLCYTVPGSPPVRAWLEAGELDGPSHLISRVEIEHPSPEQEQVSGCPSLSWELTLSATMPVRLGMTKRQLIDALGTPSARNNGVIEWIYTGKLKHMRRGKVVQLDRIIDLRAFVEGGRVQRLSAGQTTTD